MRHLWLLLVTGIVALVAAPAAGAVSWHDGDGLHISSVQRINPRLTDLTVTTAALPQPAHVRILLPAAYARHPRRRYPVLYLLHGTSGRASDWTMLGGTQATTAGLPLIVVMPDIALNGDGGGWCSNWPDGAYQWERFHIDQLLPWVDGHLRTIARRGGRAIAGLSQGGFCSMSYAARHPDLFSVALAYSGAPDIYRDLDVRAGVLGIINATEVGLDHVAPDSIFGDPITDGINWAAHDPATLVQNLRTTKLFMYFGDGSPGPYDNPSAPNGGADALEAGVARDNVDFHAHLQSLGIPSVYDPYGPGTHSWPYWARDLRWSIGPVMAALTHPSPAPAAFTYTSAENSYSVYGWTVTMHRTAREFSTLGGASQQGFTLHGSGLGTVLTAPEFTPRRRYTVTLAGTRSGHQVLQLTAGADRRLQMSVPLGPANPYQQDTAMALLAGTAVYSTDVTITALGPTPAHKPRPHRHKARPRPA
jgi:S-formylglutathione hydrolase FrmB